jgi:ectoine hydroxylase-related dioxygenase (phytanoyl-CoA dioxygenase family)
MMKLSETELKASALTPESLADAVREIEANGYVVFERVLPRDFVQELHTAFMEVFEDYIARTATNRGANRYQMHLPFRPPFNDPRIITNELVLPIVEAILGKEAICHYFASDTPLPGSDYQAVHSDMVRLFPESDVIVPPFALVLNIPLVDFREDNGPLEIWPGGTHRISAGSDEIRSSRHICRIM